MTRQTFLFTLFLSLAAAAAGGLYASTQGTAFENVIIGAGLVGVLFFAFVAGMINGMNMREEQRQRGLRRAEAIVKQEAPKHE